MIPWKRLTAETAAITGSILLAFAIDAWWGAVQTEQDIREILRVVELESTANLSNLKLSIAHHEEIVAAIQAAQVNSSTEHVHNTAVIDVEVFEPNSAALDMLISTGLLSEIDDIDLRIALGAFDGLAEDLRERELAAVQFRDASRRRIAALGERIFYDPPSGSPVFTDVEFLNLLTMRGLEEHFAVASGRKLEGHLQKIVDRLGALHP